jgi:hypothetical protein
MVMRFVRFVMRHRRWFVVPAVCLLALEAVVLVIAILAPGGFASMLGLRGCVSAGGHRVCDRYARLPKDAAGPTTTHVDPLYGRVVSSLTGRKTRVYCWSNADWAVRLAERRALWPDADPLGPWRAYTNVELLTVHLSPETCAQLSRVAEPVPLREAGSVDAVAWAVHTLAHEAAHARGILDEATAECYGLQTTADVAMQLGRSRKDADYLAAIYWKHWYVWLGGTWRSSECRPGGRLDLDRRSHWP